MPVIPNTPCASWLATQWPNTKQIWFSQRNGPASAPWSTPVLIYTHDQLITNLSLSSIHGVFYFVFRDILDQTYLFTASASLETSAPVLLFTTNDYAGIGYSIGNMYGDVYGYRCYERAGVLYLMTGHLDGLGPGHFEVWASSDSGLTWAHQDSTNDLYPYPQRSGLGHLIRPDDEDFLTLSYIGTGQAVSVRRFDLSTATWETTDIIAGGPILTPTDYQVGSLVFPWGHHMHRLSDGRYIIIYPGPLEGFRPRVNYRFYDGTWSATTRLLAGIDERHCGHGMVVGPGDMSHAFVLARTPFTDIPSIRHQSISSDGVFGAPQTIVTDSLDWDSAVRTFPASAPLLFTNPLTGAISTLMCYGTAVGVSAVLCDDASLADPTWTVEALGSPVPSHVPDPQLPQRICLVGFGAPGPWAIFGRSIPARGGGPLAMMS